MNYIKVKGYKDNKAYDIKVSNLVMGSGDFLTLENYVEAEQILDKYFELGGNIIDTARHYRHSEKTLNKWLVDKNREEIVIFTKCSHPVREFPDTARVDVKSIREDITTSLEILNTPYVDLFALHRDDETQDVGPLVEVMNELINEGKIRCYGTSNWKTNRIKEMIKYAEDNNLICPSFNSPNLSLAQTKIPRWPGCVSVDAEMLNFHRETKLPLLAWSSQAGGFFSGKYTPTNLEDTEMVDVYYSEDNWERFDRAQSFGNELGLSTTQIALSYVLNQEFPTAAVIGVDNMEQLLSSYEGSKLKIEENKVKWLNLEDKNE